MEHYPHLNKEPLLYRVGGVDILKSDIDPLIDEQDTRSRREQEDDALTTLIEDELIFQAAIAEKLHLQTEMRQFINRQYLRQKIRTKDWEPSQTEMVAYYNERKGLFRLEAKVRFQQICHHYDGIGEPEETKREAFDTHALLIANPAAFQEIAAERSEDLYRPRSGDVGFVPLSGRPGIPLATMLRAESLNDGELSMPYEIPKGWCVIQMLERRPSQERSLVQVKGEVRRKMRQDRYFQQKQQLLDSLTTKSSIRYDFDKLKHIRIPTFGTDDSKWD